MEKGDSPSWQTGSGIKQHQAQLLASGTSLVDSSNGGSYSEEEGKNGRDANIIFSTLASTRYIYMLGVVALKPLSAQSSLVMVRFGLSSTIV